MASSKPCVFCGKAGVRLTKEHAVPRWVSRLLQTRENGGVTFTSGRERRFPRHAVEVDLKVREVCPTCNNGWLHDLEMSVRRVLADAIRGLPAEPIPPKAHRALATWAVKTWLLAQHASATQPLNRPFRLQREICGLIYRDRQPPPTATVWIGAVNSAVTGMVLRVGTIRVMRDDRIVGLEGVVCIGSVLIVVYMPARLTTDPEPDRMYGLAGRKEAAPYVGRVWPSDNDAIPWPPGSLLSVDDVERIWPDHLVVLLEVEE